jgi:hypothetical protein
MRRCKCLRYKELQHRSGDSEIWVFDDKWGLIPFGSLYPLVEFDEGVVMPICPYYLYIKDGKRLSRAFYRLKELSDREISLINEAIKSCKNCVPLETYDYVEKRHAQILELIAEHMKVDIDKKLFEQFYDFIQNRSEYLDITQCLGIPPAEHDERMDCINDCWKEAFQEYLKVNK